MLKNKIDFKLINLALIMLIIFLMYRTGNLWGGVFNTCIKIISPFFVAFVIAYALYPILKYLKRKKIPQGVAIFIILAILIGIIALVTIMIGPLLFNQVSSLFNSIIAFCKEITTEYNIDLGGVQDTLSGTFDEIIKKLSVYVSDGAINAIGISINYISFFFIAFASAIYLLSDMERIRNDIKRYLQRNSDRAYIYVRRLDNEMQNYLKGFLKIVVITFFEYSIAFTLIGHPNALLLGLLAALGNLIPYFGGISVNIIAAITAFVINPALFIRTCIVFAVLSNVDGYVINPIVYGKSNELHPVVTIFAVFAGGILWGIAGIIMALPLSIILITTYKFFAPDIKEKAGAITSSKKNK